LTRKQNLTEVKGFGLTKCKKKKNSEKGMVVSLLEGTKKQKGPLTPQIPPKEPLRREKITNSRGKEKERRRKNHWKKGEVGLFLS